MGLDSLQLHLIVSHVSSSYRRPFLAGSHFSSRSNQTLAFGLAHRSTLFRSFSYLKISGPKRSCSDSFDEFHSENLDRNFDPVDDNENDCEETADAVSGNSNSSESNDEESSEKMVSKSFSPSKIQFLEPNLLGIQPEPPEWPERNKILRMIIERRVNSVDIPISLRMIKKKQKWQKSLVVAGNFAYCSMKKAFYSMVLIIQELHSHALFIRENLYSEDLQGVMDKVRMELNVSLVWLFQQVFSRTPTLMVYVMLLLANFTLHSIAGNAGVGAIRSPRVCHETIIASTEETDQEQSNIVHHAPLIRYPNVVPEGTGQNQEMTPQEVGLWNSMVEEASRMQIESGYEILDLETVKQFSSPVNVELEPTDNVEYYRTDLFYQTAIAEDPKNPLLLSNYAQFLCTVRRDYDR